MFHVMVNLCSLLFPDQYDPVRVAPLVVALAVLVLAFHRVRGTPELRP